MESNKFKINRAPLEDLEIELTKPVTFIYADNGVGKTTISRFFKDYNTKSNIDSIPVEVFNADLMSTYFHFKNQNPESKNQINSVLEFAIEDNEDITAIKTQMQEKEDDLKDTYKQIKSYNKGFSSSNESLSKLYQDIDCNDDKIKKKKEELENIYKHIHNEIKGYGVDGYKNFNKDKIIKCKKGFTEESLKKKSEYKQQLKTYSQKQNASNIDIILEYDMFDESSNKDGIINIFKTPYELQEKPFLDNFEAFIREGIKQIDNANISKNDKCIFCKQMLSEEAINYIKSYFDYFKNCLSKDSDTLKEFKKQTEKQIALDCNINRIEDRIKDNQALKLDKEISTYKLYKNKYIKKLEDLQEDLNSKISNMIIKKSLDFTNIQELKNEISECIKEINEKISIYNQNLDNNRKDIEQVLEKFIAILLHEDEFKINTLERDIKTLQDEAFKEENKLKNLEADYLELEKKLPNKQKYSKAVEKMNDFLGRIWCGNKRISISLNSDNSQYKVILTNNSKKIDNPIFSESEKNSIVLAYFFTKLENFLITHEEKANIIVIDDPMNSFDDKICSNIYEIFASIMFQKKDSRYHKINEDYKNTRFLLLTHNYKFLYCFKNTSNDLHKKINLYELSVDAYGKRNIKEESFKFLPIFGLEYLMQIAKVFYELYGENKTKDFSKNYRQFIELLSNLIDDKKKHEYTTILSQHRYNEPSHTPLQITVDNLTALFESIKQHNDSIYNNIKKCAEDLYNGGKEINLS